MNRVKELREAKGISQKELAIELRVAQPTISDWENQKKSPKGKNLLLLADFFGVDSAYILGYAGDKTGERNPAMDDDTWYIRERLRRDPNMRMLFSVADRASPEHIRAAAAMLKALEPEDFSE